MKRLFLVLIILSVSIQIEAAKMSSYTNNTTPNEDVYFIGVDPNDTTQTANGSNYRYSLSSILGSGLLNFNVNSLTVSGTGDSWLELENNTSFTDSLTGKYGIRFYNGVLQQILNGTATNIGSATIQELASDPAYTDLDTGEMAVSTASGDLFIKTATGLYTIAGTYAADPTTPTLVSLTIPAAGTTAEAVFSEAMAIGAGGAGGWTLNDPTVAMTRTGGTGTVEDPVIFSLARTVLSTATENPYASYTQPTNGFESADDGVDLASITNATVTNNSTQTGVDYSDIIFWSGFEGTWSSPTYTTSVAEYPEAITGAGSSAVVVNATAANVGTNGLSAPTGGDYITFTSANAPGLSFNDMRVGFWFRMVTTWVSGAGLFYSEYDISNFLGITCAAGGEIQVQLRNAGTYVVSATTTGLSLSADTWYYAEAVLDQSSGFTLKINNTNTSIVNDAYTTFAVAPVLFRCGNHATGAVSYYDNFVISTDTARDLYLLRNETESPR